MPARCKRSRLRLAIAHDACNDKTGIIKGCAVSMRERVAEFAAFVNRTGCLRGHVARDAARKRELREKAFHALLIERDVRITLTVGPFELSVRAQAGPAVARTRDVDHVEIVLLDHPVQVDIDEVQAWRRSPVAE